MMQDNALPAHRRAELVKYVLDRGHATVAELAAGFAVSMDTIRRDLDHLAERGRLARTHGGAMRLDELARADTPFDNRMDVHHDGKEAIAAAAAKLVTDGETMLINGGTTTLAFGRALTGKRNLTVVTNNLRLPLEVPASAVHDVYVLGGSCRVSSMVTVGPVAFPGSQGLSVDLAVIGVGGVSAENGLSTTNLTEAQMMQEMIGAAARVIVVADSSKFGRSTFVHICELSAISVLVTDQTPPEDLGTALKAAGVELIVAGAAGA
jgi:DeoR/GlpR family transcriptional regulator of sugar metabolism